MKSRIAEENMEESHNQEYPTEEMSPQKGGLRTMPFIIANESFERVASLGILPNMIFYLMNGYNMSTATASSFLSYSAALSNFLAIPGAFISDSYLGRFQGIAIGSICSLLGLFLVWLTAMIPAAQPAPCTSSNICRSPNAAQLALLLCSFGFLSIGAGFVRPSSIAFGADQFIKRGNLEKEERVLDSYFNWYYASIGLSTTLALTVIVYIQDQLGWKVGFGVPVIIMFLSLSFFYMGSFLYVKLEAPKSLFTRLAQVLVAAWKNRHLALPPNGSNGCYFQSNDSKYAVPSHKQRFLNKACIIRDEKKVLKPDGSISKPWELCTVDQVEELKSFIRIIPIWSTGIIIYGTMKQNITVLQANSMNRHVTSNFQIPAGSFSMFIIITVTIWVAFYDRILVPLLTKYTNQPRGISAVNRMGIGLAISCMAMALAAFVESIRRRIAIEEGLSDDPTAVVGMSALWLVPQFCLIGLAEGLNAVGQIEFYFSQLPKGMTSMAMAIFTLGTAFAGLVGALIVNIVDAVTTSGGRVSWLSKNLNIGHYDYYYGLLTFLSLLNFVFFLVCCRAFGPCEEGRATFSDGTHDLKEGLLSKSEEFPTPSLA